MKIIERRNPHRSGGGLNPHLESQHDLLEIVRIHRHRPPALERPPRPVRGEIADQSNRKRFLVNRKIEARFSGNFESNAVPRPPHNAPPVGVTSKTSATATTGRASPRQSHRPPRLGPASAAQEPLAEPPRTRRRRYTAPPDSSPEPSARQRRLPPAAPAGATSAAARARSQSDTKPPARNRLQTACARQAAHRQSPPAKIGRCAQSPPTR